MWHGSRSIEISAPPEKVWEAIADLRNHQRIHGSGEVNWLRAPDGPIGLGSTFESENTIKGAGTFVARETIIEFEPDRALGWRSEPPPIRKGDPESVPDITWRYVLSPSPAGGTKVEHSFRVAEPKHGALMLKLFYLTTRRAAAIVRGVEKTLVNLKALVEGSAA